MHFRVAVGEYIPFLRLRTDENGILRMSGPLSDVFELLSEKINFTYTLYRSKGDSWGILGENGWTGMLGMMSRNEADLAIGPFTLSYGRWKAFETSVPVYIDQVEILVPVFEWQMSLFNMLRVFSVKVWVLIFISVLILCIVSSIVDHTERRNFNFVFGFYANLWVLGRTLLQEGKVNRPRSCPQVFLSVFWMLGTLVLANVFSGVLLTNLLLRRSRKIDSIFDLIAAPDMFPIIEPQSSIFYRFQEGTAEMYKAIFKKANSNPEKCILTYGEMRTIGMDQVLTGHYALITDAMGLRGFLSQRYKDRLPCRFRLAQEPLWNLWKVIAFQKTFPKHWIQQMNVLLRHTAESGWLDQRMRNEFLSYSECISTENVEIESLGLKHTIGTFIILVIGLAFSSVALILEILHKKSRPVSHHYRSKVNSKRK